MTIKLKLTQQPYISDNDTYKASAVDINDEYEDNFYTIFWNQTESFKDSQNSDSNYYGSLEEGDACDWDKYEIYKDGELLDNADYELDQNPN